MSERLKTYATVSNLIFACSLILFAVLVHYFFTGLGGPRYLAVRMVPLAFIIQILLMYQSGALYGRLPGAARIGLVMVQIGICLYALGYLTINYDDVAIWRQGAYNTHDFIVGLLVFLLVMELSRIAHPILFWVNVVMVFYTLYGNLVPRWADFFWHPGTTFYRVVTSSTVEFATGVYGVYAQLALTLIAAFLLLAAVAAGFDAQSALVQVVRRLAGRSRHTVPQTAVLSSVSVGMVSGSGSANAAVVGSFTIPLMMRYGIPGHFAAAVEAAASMGGLIMPPLMAAAGFIMADFLGVPYWEVVIRGFAVAFVYFVSLSLAVYLLSVRLLPGDPIQQPRVPLYAQVKTGIFFSAILFLIYLMGWLRYGELRAALYTGEYLLILLTVAWAYFKFVRKDSDLEGENLLANVRRAIETHGEMTSYLTLLLAILGIMIGLFTVTGFILRMGAMMLEVGDWHIIATILMAWAFGWLVGSGLPPTATYIIVAIVIVPPLRELGIDPWVAHFFAFLVAVWGELSPPTSLTAAVASRIAEASFLRTMWEALKICLPVTFMTFAIFVRSDMVVNPGWPQLVDTALVTIGTSGITFAIFGQFTQSRALNLLPCSALALLALVTIFHPEQAYALAGAAIVLPAVVFGVMRHRQFAPPPGSESPMMQKGAA